MFLCCHIATLVRSIGDSSICIHEGVLFIIFSRLQHAILALFYGVWERKVDIFLQ